MDKNGSKKADNTEAINEPYNVTEADHVDQCLTIRMEKMKMMPNHKNK